MFPFVNIRMAYNAPAVVVIWTETGHLGPNGVVKGRPPLRDRAKQQVTLRLDSDVLANLDEGGPGGQKRINAALRAAAGLEKDGPLRGRLPHCEYEPQLRLTSNCLIAIA